MFSFLRPKPSPQQAALDAIGRQLDAVEAEMKAIGYWSADPPDLQAAFARGEMRTYMDAPSFELWLQQIFIPNARRGVADKRLPKTSQVGAMAMRQYDYHDYVEEAQRLLKLLGEFDRTVEQYGRDFPG